MITKLLYGFQLHLKISIYYLMPKRSTNINEVINCENEDCDNHVIQYVPKLALLQSGLYFNFIVRCTRVCSLVASDGLLS
jgi:hypothetical protein